MVVIKSCFGKIISIEGEDDMDLAKRIQELRKKQGLSQEELAHEIGVSRQAVSKWEMNQAQPDLDKIIQLSDYFQVSTDYLLKGIECNTEKNEINGKQVIIIATICNAIGLLLTVVFWREYQNWLCFIPVLVFQAGGLLVYLIGISNKSGKEKNEIKKKFWRINIWLIALIPCILLTDTGMGFFFGLPSFILISIAVFPYLTVCGLVWILVARNKKM